MQVDGEDKSSLPLSLRPVPSDKGTINDQTSISALLHRIGRQRGSFRNFTEESLEAELANIIPGPALDEPSARSTIDGEEKTEEPALTDEQAVDRPIESRVREEVLELIGVALNEAALALDFTSLLLSSSKQSAGQSMSPALRNAVPAGSLNHIIVRREKIQQNASNATQLGFQAQGLTHAAFILRQASRATTSDHETESIFWSEVLALIAAGWPVFKIRPTGVGLAVRFGSGSRHFIVMEKDANGHIDTSKLTIRDSHLQFTIRRKDKVVLRLEDYNMGESTREATTEILEIVDKLARIRRSILVNASFEHLVREARECANQGFSVTERLISIPLNERTTVELELLDGLSEQPEKMEDIEMAEEDLTAKNTDRLLLSALRALIQSDESRITERNCLKIFMTWFSHGRQVSQLHKQLQTLITGLGRYQWIAEPPSTRTVVQETTINTEALLEPASSMEILSFLSAEVVITLTTSRIGVAHYSIAAWNAQVPEPPKVTHSLDTHDIKQVLALVHFELNEALMTYLSVREPSIIRCSEGEVRTEAGRTALFISTSGEIQLVRVNGVSRSLKSDVVKEVCEEDVETQKT